MTISYGLTVDGFVPKPLNVVRAEINAALQAAFGASIDLSDKSIFGQIVGINAERFALLWELAQAVNASQDPDQATGAALDALCLLTGTLRPQATNSTVTLTLTGVPTTLVASGSKASIASTHEKFETEDNATITALTAWATSTGYSAGDRRTNAGRAYECITAGTSSTPGPSSTADDIADGGGVHWTYLGDGTGAIDVDASAVDTGPIEAVARDITVIETPVGGWQGVINLLDVEPGRDVATDEELRTLRELELSASGRTTADAIRARLLQLQDVFAVTVFVNNTDVTDGNGLPPHSVECLVRGGEDQDIIDTIYANVAAGIATYGTTSGTAVDSEGVSHDVSFSRPDEIEVYVDITLTYDASEYPSDGDAQVKLAIVEWGQKFPVGLDVRAAAVGAQAFKVAGVLDAARVEVYSDVIDPTPSAWAGTTGYSATPGARDVVSNDGGRTYICITSGTSAGSGGPTGTGTDITDGTVHWRYLGATLAMAVRDLAVFDTGRINVHSSAVTP